MVNVSCGGHRFEWVEVWASMPAAAGSDLVWAHHGLATTTDQMIVTYRAEGGSICLLDHDGRLVDRWPSGLVGAHGVATSIFDGGREELWIADTGLTAVPNGTGGYTSELVAPGRVASFDLRGNHLLELPSPDLPTYTSARYMPTGAAIDGRTGAIWVADGYGAGLVHRYSRSGELELTLTGEEGGGRFSCPHAVFIDHRGNDPRLYVADRGNARVQIYDLNGTYRQQVTEGLRSPSAFAASGQTLVVAELHGRITLLNEDDRLIGYLGRDDQAPERPGWPNAVADDGRTIRPPDLRPGHFNSPHGLTVDAHGNIYVAEWLLGGRIIQLRVVQGEAT